MMRTSHSSDRTDRYSVLRSQPNRQFSSCERFDIAVMKETLLLVELEMQEFCIDLRALSNIVLSDLGATLQILRLAGREYGGDDVRPLRMEDCIASLGVDACLDAMSLSFMLLDSRSKAVAGLWSHSREIAGHSKRLADQTLDVDPDQAYLVGLCHAIGSLESLMGRGAKARQAPDLPRVGLELAREWSLPSCVVDYFSDLEMYGGRSSWVGIVQAAHRAADGTPSEWASGNEIHPQMLWAV